MTAPTYQKDSLHPSIRFWNRVGPWLDRLHLRLPQTHLDEDYIVSRAMRSTKLKDFGPDHFRDPFRVLLKAAKEEGELTWYGGVAVHGVLFSGLRNRLWRTEAFRRHPEILEQPVRRPLIVAGAPRTGTTLMNHLLSLDPVCRPLLMWEAFCSVPWHYRRQPRWDPRYTAFAIFVWYSKRVAPELAIMHDFGHNVPDECHWLLWPTFVWPPAMVLPSYREWMIRQPETTYDHAYAEYRQALQMLHWQRPAKGHWVLKSPLHSWALPALMKAVPEASIIHTHRNLREVIPSFCSLGAALMRPYTDSVEAKRMGPVAMEIARQAVDRFSQARSAVDERRICDVRFSDLVRDPIGSVKTVYAKLDYEFTPEFERNLARFSKENPSSNRPKHVYTLDQFNLDGDAIAAAFADYHGKYGLEKD